MISFQKGLLLLQHSLWIFSADRTNQNSSSDRIETMMKKGHIELASLSETLQKFWVGYIENWDYWSIERYSESQFFLSPWAGFGDTRMENSLSAVQCFPNEAQVCLTEREPGRYSAKGEPPSLNHRRAVTPVMRQQASKCSLSSWWRHPSLPTHAYACGLSDSLPGLARAAQSHSRSLRFLRRRNHSMFLRQPRSQPTLQQACLLNPSPTLRLCQEKIGS